MKPLYFIIIFTIAFGTVASAKQVSVDVIKDDIKTIKAEVVNITAGTDIDIKQAFTSLEKTKVKEGLNLTLEESDALEAVLAGEALQGDKIDTTLSVFNKQLNEKPLHEEEVRMLLGLNGKKQPLEDSMRYLGRKKIKDI